MLAASEPAAATTARAWRPEAGVTSKIVLPGRVLGFRRSYRLHLPAGVPTAGEPAGPPRPLVVALHGGVATAAIFERQSNFSAVADREGFVVAYPNGIGIFSLLRHWNGGFCCAKAMRAGIDDVAFVDRVVDDVTRRTPIDRSRVYLVGYSNGGMLAYLYAAQRSEAVAAVGIFASSTGLVAGGDAVAWTPPAPTAAVPMTIYHGTDDPRLPPEGRTGRSDSTLRTLGPLASARFWAEANGCATAPETVERPEGAVTTWCADAAAPVRLQMLEGWNHDWPGPKYTDRIDDADPLAGFDAASEMWRFFEASARR